jgi:hypothetical protein
VSSGAIYAGGAFSNIGGAPRSFIAALDPTSGAATAWDPSASNQILALAVTGGTVYAGGTFTTVGGAARNRIAALDAATGAATSWDPNAANTVYALAVSGTTVYAGGAFTSIGGAGRNRVAALDATSGVATAWNPDANNLVLALAAGGGKVYAGGAFTLIGGLQRRYFAAFTSDDLASVPWTPGATPNIAFTVSPNPATTALTVELTLHAAGRAKVEVFDVRGSRVKTLGEGAYTAGAHRFAWDGSDRRGGSVPAGIYLVRLLTEQGEATKRVAWIANR